MFKLWRKKRELKLRLIMITDALKDGVTNQFKNGLDKDRKRIIKTLKALK